MSTVMAQPLTRPTVPIISHGGGGWKNSQVNDFIPIIDPNDATKLVAFFMGEAAPVTTGNFAVGRATASVSGFSAASTWTEDAGNPVLTATSNHLRPCAAVVDGTIIFLYCLDYAVSGNIITVWFSANSGATWIGGLDCITLTGQGRDDGYSIDNCGVIKEGSIWHMAYTVLPTAPSGGGSTGGGFDAVIRYASSANGVDWTKSGSDLLGCGPQGASDYFGIEWHQLRKIGSTYFITYEAATSVSPYQSPGNTTTYTCNMAFSSSMTSGWQKVGNNPVWPNSNIVGRFDRYHTATPYFFEVNGVEYLAYSGGLDADQHNFDIGIATMTGDLSLRTSFYRAIARLA